MVAFICGVWRDYDARTEIDKVLLRREKTGVCGSHDHYDSECDIDDVADYIILLWDGVTDFGGGQVIDFADFAGGDGASVCDRSFCWGAGSGVCSFLVCDKVTGFSYFSGGVVWRDEMVYGGD